MLKNPKSPMKICQRFPNSSVNLFNIPNISSQILKIPLEIPAVCGAAIFSNPTCSKQPLDTQMLFNADTQLILATVKPIRRDRGCHIRGNTSVVRIGDQAGGPRGECFVSGTFLPCRRCQSPLVVSIRLGNR